MREFTWMDLSACVPPAQAGRMDGIKPQKDGGSVQRHKAPDPDFETASELADSEWPKAVLRIRESLL